MLSLVGNIACLCSLFWLLGFVVYLLLLWHWTWCTACLYGLGLGCALCKLTGFDGAVAAF